MRFKEGPRFLLLTAGVFCLMLGIAVLFFSLIEWAFFRVQVIGQFIAPSAAAILVGIALMHVATTRASAPTSPPTKAENARENALPPSASLTAK